MARGNVGSIALNRETGFQAWHAQAKSWFPEKDNAAWNDMGALAREYVFKGFGPAAPVFGNEDRILTIGSCFAMEIRRALIEAGRQSDQVDIPAGLNNTFAIRQFIEWVVTGAHAEDGYWYDRDETTGEVFRYQPAQREAFLRAFERASAFIITVGLAEVWRDRKTGGVFWRGVPKDVFDTAVHEVHVSTVAENVTNLKRIAALISGMGKHTVITLSPVPLNATFRDRPTLVSDCVSKSILRVAIEELFNSTPPNCWYWPSFEMVRWVGAHTATATLEDEASKRHANPAIVRIIIREFMERFFTP
jgi:hypothetical protein